MSRLLQQQCCDYQQHPAQQNKSKDPRGRCTVPSNLWLTSWWFIFGPPDFPAKKMTTSCEHFQNQTVPAVASENGCNVAQLHGNQLDISRANSWCMDSPLW